MTYSYAFAVLWSAWMISWALGALWSSKVAARPPEKQERFYWLLTLAGAVLIMVNFRNGRMEMIWTQPDWVEWSLFALASIGLAFTWWARIHLGRLWSGRITRTSSPFPGDVAGRSRLDRFRAIQLPGIHCG